MDPGSLADLWLRGPAAVRRDARRVLAELVERGELDPVEARELERSIDEAVAAGERLFRERVLDPLGRVLAAAAASVAEAAAAARRADGEPDGS